MTPVSDVPAAPANSATPDIVIRPALAADAGWIEALQALAFGPGRFARAAFRVRERFAVDDSLSLVAEIGAVPVASVAMTPISVGGVNGYLLGPLATDPLYRKKGAGRALVRAVCDKALARGTGAFVLLVGDEPYYGPLGFVPTRPGAIRFPSPVDPNRILVHAGGSAKNTAMAERLSGALTAPGTHSATQQGCRNDR